MFKQAPHDHRIRDVRDLHLIETQHPCLRRDAFGHGEYRILHPVLAGGGHRAMNLLHKGMEMDAPRRHIQRLIEQIHQHGFATPNTAPHIETKRPFTGLFLGKNTKQRLFLRLRDPQAQIL